MTELRNLKIYDDAVGPAELDDATNSLQTIDYPHHEIHSGSSYVCKGFTDLANGAVIDLRFTTQNSTTWAHIFPEFETETEYQYFIYEDVAIDGIGTAYTPINRNRNFNGGVPEQSVTVIDIIENATVILADVDTNLAGSVLIYQGITGSAKKAGGGTRAQNEFIFKQGIIYCLRLVCISAGWADFKVSWYEHADKN